MELSQLEYFRVLCKYGNYTKASQELYVSQPTISMAIRRLEEEFGGELISRRSKLFKLTPKGEVLLSWAVRIHNDVEEALQDMSAFSMREREIIRLSFPFPLCPELLVEGIPRFDSEHTGVALHLLQAGHVRSVAGLTDHTVDISIICKDMLTPSLDYHFYKRLEYRACFAADHRFRNVDKITPEMLKDERLIIPKIANTITRAAQDYFLDYDFRPEFSFVDIFPADVWQLAARGEGIAFMPVHSQRGQRVPLSPPLYTELVVAWPKNEALTRNKQDLIEYLSTLWVPPEETARE